MVRTDGYPVGPLLLFMILFLVFYFTATVLGMMHEFTGWHAFGWGW